MAGFGHSPSSGVEANRLADRSAISSSESREQSQRRSLTGFENEECPICRSQIIDRAVTNTCRHGFDRECLENFIRLNRFSRPPCPVCRTRFSEIYHQIESEVSYQTIPVATLIPHRTDVDHEGPVAILGRVVGLNDILELRGGRGNDIMTQGPITLRMVSRQNRDNSSNDDQREASGSPSSQSSTLVRVGSPIDNSPSSSSTTPLFHFVPYPSPDNGGSSSDGDQPQILAVSPRSLTTSQSQQLQQNQQSPPSQRDHPSPPQSPEVSRGTGQQRSPHVTRSTEQGTVAVQAVIPLTPAAQPVEVPPPLRTSYRTRGWRGRGRPPVRAIWHTREILELPNYATRSVFNTFRAYRRAMSTRQGAPRFHTHHAQLAQPSQAQPVQSEVVLGSHHSTSSTITTTTTTPNRANVPVQVTNSGSRATITSNSRPPGIEPENQTTRSRTSRPRSRSMTPSQASDSEGSSVFSVMSPVSQRTPQTVSSVRRTNSPENRARRTDSTRHRPAVRPSNARTNRVERRTHSRRQSRRDVRNRRSSRSTRTPRSRRSPRTRR